jgi:hypothetical protein
METNPYEYDTTVQNQLYEGRYVTARTGRLQPPVLQNQGPQPGSGNQKPGPSEKMPKARALALAHMLKKWLAIASLVSFGTFSGLVAFHQVGTTNSQTSQINKTSSGSSQATPTTSSSSQNSNSFLNQQGGNNFGTSSSSQTPVSGAHTS